MRNSIDNTFGDKHRLFTLCMIDGDDMFPQRRRNVSKDEINERMLHTIKYLLHFFSCYSDNYVTLRRN